MEPGWTPAHIGALGNVLDVPEGHTIHRLAADLQADLQSHPVRASSPQGRFDDGATRLDGRDLLKAEAYGKHLFCWWDGDDILHVHLGLIGKFRPFPAAEDPGESVRLRLESPATAWHLTGPQTCRVISPPERDQVVAELGPDPLRRGSRRRDEFVDRFTSTSRAAGVALLDQHIVAGIGNVYRAEILFLRGIHPAKPANAVDPDEAGAIWDLTVDQLRRGKKWNRIVTVDDDDVDRRVTRRIKRDDALYAYKRTGLPCRRCHDHIVDTELGGRSIWLCPTCQPR